MILLLLFNVDIDIQTKLALAFAFKKPNLIRSISGREYTRTRVTQRSHIVDGRQMISWVDSSPEWTKPGGLQGFFGVTTKVFRSVPGTVRYFIRKRQITNSAGMLQDGYGIERSYPDGTRFDEVLSTEKGIFEHRVREKISGKWKSRVAFKDADARPEAYTGLTVSCSSCHDRAGENINYYAGFVPGGDTVFSDPMDIPPDLSVATAVPRFAFPARMPMLRSSSGICST